MSDSARGRTATWLSSVSCKHDTQGNIYGSWHEHKNQFRKALARKQWPQITSVRGTLSFPYSWHLQT